MIRLTVGRNGTVKKQQLNPKPAHKIPTPKAPLPATPTSPQPNITPKKAVSESKPKKETLVQFDIPEEEILFACKTPILPKQELRSRMSSEEFKAQNQHRVSPVLEVEHPIPHKSALPIDIVKKVVLEEHRSTGLAGHTGHASTKQSASKESTPAIHVEDEIEVEKGFAANVAAVAKVFVDECIQTVEVVDDMPIRYRNKAEALNKELIEMREKHEFDLVELAMKHAKELQMREAVETAAVAQRHAADAEVKANQCLVSQRLDEIQRKCNTAESSKHALQEQIKSQRASLQDKDEQLHTAHSEKMETFKQFRALNRLYEELKESSEAVEGKRNHLIQHAKDLEVKCGLFDKDQRVMREQLRVAGDELAVAKRGYEEVALEKTKLKISGNDLKEIEYMRKMLEAQKHKAVTAQETIESLMRFPDTSLGEDDNQISLSSPKFDMLVQEYVKGNCLRILVLETKNEEYRTLRMQHAELYAKQNPRVASTQQEIPQLLFNPVTVSDTLGMVERPLEPARRRVSDVESQAIAMVEKTRSLERVNTRERDLFVSPKGSSTDMTRDMISITTPDLVQGLVRRSSMSGGKRGIGLTKNVSWHNDDF